MFFRCVYMYKKGCKNRDFFLIKQAHFMFQLEAAFFCADTCENQPKNRLIFAKKIRKMFKFNLIKGYTFKKFITIVF